MGAGYPVTEYYNLMARLGLPQSLPALLFYEHALVFLYFGVRSSAWVVTLEIDAW